MPLSCAEISCDEEDRNLIQNTMQPCLNSAEEGWLDHSGSREGWLDHSGSRESWLDHSGSREGWLDHSDSQEGSTSELL